MSDYENEDVIHQKGDLIPQAAIYKVKPNLPDPRPLPKWELMRVISGHTGWVRTVAVDTVSNNWFATGSADRTIKIWDLASGTLKLTLTGHISTIRGITISDRHPYLFSVGEDKMVKCWDLEQNRVVRHYHGHLSGVYSVAIHPVLDVLVTGGRDSVPRVWDIRTKQAIFTMSGHRDAITSLLTLDCDPQIISGSHDSTVRLWDLRTGKTLTELTHNKKSVRALTLAPSNEFTFASAAPGKIKKFGLPNGVFLHDMTEMEGNAAINGKHDLTEKEHVYNCVAVNQDGVLIGGTDDGFIGIWDWYSGSLIQSMKTAGQSGTLDAELGICSAAFDKSGMRLLTGEMDKTIKIWRECSI